MNKIKSILSKMVLGAFKFYFVLMILGVILAFIAGGFRACGAFLGPLPPD